MSNSVTARDSETSTLTYGLVPVECITPSEQTDSNHVKEIERMLIERGSVRPIVLLKSPLVENLDVSDGHHRLAALKRLRCKKAPAYVLYTPDHVFGGGNRDIIVDVDGTRYTCLLKQAKYCILTGKEGDFVGLARLPEPVVRYLTRETSLAELA